MKRWKGTYILLCLAATLLASPVPEVHAGKANFGMNTPGIKVADSARGWIPNYGPGKNLVVDGTTLHVSYSNDDIGDSDLQIRYVVSKDAGTVWEKSELIAKDPHYMGNGVHLALGDNPAEVHFVWGRSSVGTVEPRKIMYANRSTSTPVEVQGTTDADTLSRAIAADANGGVHIVFKGDDDLGNTGIYYSRSQDGGATFPEIATLVDVIEYGANNVEPDVAVDVFGDVHVVWYEAIDAARSQWSVYFSKRSGGAWSPPRIISGALSGDYPSISIAGNHVAVAWFDWWSAGPTSIAVGLSDDYGVTWDVANFEEEFSNFRPGVAVDDMGVVNVVWEDQQRGVMFSRSVNGGNSWSNAISVDSTLFQPPSTFITAIDPKIAVDATGKAYILYHDDRRDILKFTREK